MNTIHKLIFDSSVDMKMIPSETIDLIVTSPPYPMIEMWDDIFSKQNPEIEQALKNDNGLSAFELMHQILDQTWNEAFRVLKEGGIACINIGDATRTINHNFQLFNNHSRIINHCIKIGFQTLPEIIWRKQTNAPNKFMGSGMLPPGAYITLEHEFILIFRKGNKRVFKSEEEKQLRKESAFFWEERNNWFSDIWIDLKGTLQELDDKSLRKRSASYPFELPYRLINMFSIKNDTVLDPFLGTGTTTLSAMTSGRNSFGFEVDNNFHNILDTRINTLLEKGNAYIIQRLFKHIDFVKNKINNNEILKKTNLHYNFPCVSSQETEIIINSISELIKIDSNNYKVIYHNEPQKNICEYCKEQQFHFL